MSGESNSSRHYRVDEWGNGYFSVDDEGRIRVHPRRDPDVSVVLDDVVGSLDDTGLGDPLMIRFPQILTDRLERIQSAFAAAIKEYGYTRHYQGLFPVKVNHDRNVVQTLVESGHAHRFGLEVGSKAELCLALTMSLHPEALIVCNGLKDRDYLELAVHAQRHGRRVMVIIENPQEIEDVIAVTRRLGQRVLLGFRARLHASGVGRWQESTGAKGKFGLSTIEILEGIEHLREVDMLDDLVCLHFHIGSQVCDILHLKEAIKEGSRLYCAMKRRAPKLDYLDVGGGLGVDYDGSRTTTEWSVNYTLDEYARDSVWIVHDICERSKVDPPIIMSESGRALTAYHALIVVSSVRVVGGHESRDYSKFEAKSHQVEELKIALAEINAQNYREAFHDATVLKNELLSGFKLGYVGIEDRAVGECLYRDICDKVRSFLPANTLRTPDMMELERALTPKYVCNFSVFMSAPDSWAVQQLFPVAPLSRHNEETSPATICDITCDSDGKVERFVGRGKPEPFLPLHDIKPGEPYRIAIFTVGAYQDVLGDFHNLFGTVNEAVVQVEGVDSFAVVDTEEASSVEMSLDYFGFPPADMVRRFDRLMDRATDPEQRKEYKGAFLRVLHGNTYLERI